MEHLASSVEATTPVERKLPPAWIPGQLDLRDTWFPVAHARDIGNQPVLRIVHSQHYWLWRDGHKVLASEWHPQWGADRRRQASAFTGGTGMYPAEVRYGYVWAWYGNPAHADTELIPRIPFLPIDGDLPSYTRRTVRFDAGSLLSVENLLDLTHADFLHAQVIGDHQSEEDQVEVEWTSETLTRTRTVAQKSVAPIMRWLGGVQVKYQDVRFALHVHLRSNVCISYPRFRPGFDIPNVQPFVPVGSHRSRVDVVQNTTAAPLPFRYLMPRASYIIRNQDNIAVRPQDERYLDPDSRPDLHSRFDKPGGRYRFLMQQLAKRQAAGDFAYGADADPQRDIRQLLGMEVCG